MLKQVGLPLPGLRACCIAAASGVLPHQLQLRLLTQAAHHGPSDTMLEASTKLNPGAPRAETFSSGFATRATVGIMLKDRFIDNMVVGGVCFPSRPPWRALGAHPSAMLRSPVDICRGGGIRKLGLHFRALLGARLLRGMHTEGRACVEH